MNEKEIDYLESLIPNLMIGALNIAYFKTLESGNSLIKPGRISIWK